MRRWRGNRGSTTAGGAAGDRTTEVGRGGCGALGYAAADSAGSVDGDAGVHMGAEANAGTPTRISSTGEAAREEAPVATDGFVGGGGVEAAAGYGDVGDEDFAKLITTECHHEGAASGVTGDVTGIHVDEGPGRRVGEDRAAGTRRAGLANVAASRVTHEGAPAGGRGPAPAGIGPGAAAVPRGAKRRPSEAATCVAGGPDSASAEPRQMSKGKAAEAGASAGAQEGREPKNRRNIFVHRHRSCGPTERNRTEGMRVE